MKVALMSAAIGEAMASTPSSLKKPVFSLGTGGLERWKSSIMASTSRASKELVSC